MAGAGPPLEELFERGIAPEKALRFYGLKLWEVGHPGLAAQVLRVAAGVSPSDPQIWIGPGFHSPSFVG